MNELPFGPTTPRVTEFQVKDELDQIDREIEPRILTFEIPIALGAMVFNRELDTIDVNLPTVVQEINLALSYFPDLNWRDLLRKMVEHELAHKNQFKFLSNHGISFEQQMEPHYWYLKEFQACNAVPDPVRKQVYLQELRKATARQIERELESLRGWAASVVALSREDIREIFGPYNVVEPMLKLKDIAEKVRTKEDIIRYAQETKEFLRLPIIEESR